jgi:hypothetical protein
MCSACYTEALLQEYINQIAEKNPQQSFEGSICITSSRTKTNMVRMTGFINL